MESLTKEKLYRYFSVTTEALTKARGTPENLDIHDGIRAIHLVAKYGKKGEAYNIASGKTISLEFILKELIRISKLKKIRLKIKRNNTLIPKDEIPEIRLNPSKIKRLSGWRAQIPIEKTLHDILNEWRKQVRSKSK